MILIKEKALSSDAVDTGILLFDVLKILRNIHHLSAVCCTIRFGCSITS